MGHVTKLPVLLFLAVLGQAHRTVQLLLFLCITLGILGAQYAPPSKPFCTSTVTSNCVPSADTNGNQAFGNSVVSAVTGRFHARPSIPSQAVARQAMASPPTTTMTTSHTIGSPILWPSVVYGTVSTNVAAEYFAYSRAGNPVIHGTAFPDYNYVHFTSVNYGGGTLQANVYGASYLHTGSALEISFKGITGSFLVKVNDQYISLTPQSVTQDGNQYFYYIPFGSTATRRIDLIAYNSPFAGVYTAATDTIVPAPIRGPRNTIVGDSYTEGCCSVGGPVVAWPQVMADSLGWDDVWPSGVGSTGYLATTGSKVKFRDRLATDVYPFAPDIVTFAGGINDYPGFTASAIGAEALLCFQDVRANLPNALIVVISPFWHGGPSTFGSNLIATRDAIKASAAQVSGTIFIDVLEMPLRVPALATTLASGASSGATTISIVGTTGIFAPRSTFAFSNGERYQVKALSGVGPLTATIDGTLATTHTSGEAVTQIGDCFWTGGGKQGSTTGYGNSDVLVYSDGTHPTDAGHAALGMTIAQLLADALR